MKCIKILLTAIVVLVLASCNKNAPAIIPETQITVIDDMADGGAANPVADPLIALYEFNVDQSQAAEFRLVLVTDKLLNPTENISLQGCSLTDNDNGRAQVVTAFSDAVQQAVADFPTRYAVQGVAQVNSECFATIASELRLLAASRAARRVIIIYSDLTEHSGKLSYANKEWRQLVRSHPNAAAQLLLRHSSLPDNLAGISAYVVCSGKDQQKFSEMCILYRSLLSSRGARVIIQSTNNRFEP